MTEGASAKAEGRLGAPRTLKCSDCGREFTLEQGEASLRKPTDWKLLQYTCPCGKIYCYRFFFQVEES